MIYKTNTNQMSLNKIREGDLSIGQARNSGRMSASPHKKGNNKMRFNSNNTALNNYPKVSRYGKFFGNFTISVTAFRRISIIAAGQSARAFACLLLMLTAMIATFAQTEKSTGRGAQIGASYSVSDIESINTTNGNVMFNIPIVSLPAGRSGLSAGVTLNYNSKLWDNISPPGFSVPPGYSYDTYLNARTLKKSADGGWRYNLGYKFEQKKRPYVTQQMPCDGPNSPKYQLVDIYKFVMTFPDGSTREFKPVPYSVPAMNSIGLDGYYAVDINGTHYRYKDIYWQDGSGEWIRCEIEQIPTTNGMTFYTEDGSNLRLEVAYNSNPNAANFWTLYLPDGSRVTQNEPLPGGGTAEQRIYDRNNNFINITGIGTDLTEATDQLGRKVSIDSNTQSPDTLITASGFGGASLVWRIKRKTISVSRQYKISDDTTTFPNPGTASGTFSMIDEIVLPSALGGQAYKFQYNGNASGISGASPGMGEVSQIELPSGAKIDYEYKLDGQQSNVFLWKDTLHNPVKVKKLTSQSEYDGASSAVEEKWLYDITRTDSKVTAPNGGISRSWYTDIYDGGDGVVYKTESPDGSMYYKKHLLFGTQTIEYNKSWERLVEAECTIVPDGAGNPALALIKTYGYDHNGNVLKTSEYDWLPYSAGICSDTAINVPGGTVPKRIVESTYENATPALLSSPSLIYANEYRHPGAPRLLSLLKTTEIKDGGGNVVSRSEMTYDNPSTTGNLTQAKTWDSSKGAYSSPLTTSNSVSVTNQYDTYGNLTQSTDAKGIVSKLVYGIITTPTGTVSDLYPTQSVAAFGTTEARTTNTEYDFTSGTVKKVTDADNNVSTETEYDALARPTKVKAAAGTANEVWTQTVYDDVNRRVIVKSDIEIKGDARKVGIQHFDQLGRVRLTRTLEDAATQSAIDETQGIKVQTRYKYDNPADPANSNGVYKLASNPYRAATSAQATSEEAMGWTISYADKTGKNATTKTYAGAMLPAPFVSSGANTNLTGTVTTAIDSNIATVTDQAGKQRRSMTNGLGQLIRVDEPNDAGDLGTVTSPNQATAYSYDTLNNLVTVNQGVQTRSFHYDSLSRLKQATNPESGTISYAYDAVGNLTSKTDARSVVTTYAYDNLNRVLSRIYSDGTPAVSYTYDDTNIPYSKGKLTKVSSSVSETKYNSFDNLGRILTSQQNTDGQTYNFGYAYNLSGMLVEETYPSGRKIKNSFQTDGDLSKVEMQPAGGNYVTRADNFSYTAAGAVSSIQLGNSKWENAQFNSRLQPTQLGLGTSATDQSLWKVAYDYGNSDNNGNVKSQTITAPSITPLVQNYTYDSLNRLKSATENIQNSTETWKQTFTYDRYGNRNFDAANTTTLGNCSTAQCNPSIDAANNRFTTNQGYTYDLSGNLLTDSQNRSFVYDAENKQKEVKDASNVSIGHYFYDGDGKRVKKVSTSETTLFAYDASGKLAAEYLLTTATPQTPTTSYLTSDTLGSPRVITDNTGNVTSRRDFMPFGEEIANLGNRTSASGYQTDSTRQKFTGYEKDNETDLDYAKARMFRNGLGRFTSPDQLLSSGRPNSPQTWNRYVYVLNNPLILIDPTGTFEWDASLKDDKTLDQETRDDRKKIRDGFINARNKIRTDAAKLLANGKLSQKKYDKIIKAIDSYGDPDKANGITVGVGGLKSGVAGETSPTFTYTQDSSLKNGYSFSTNIEVKLDAKILLGNSASDLVLHEGSHVADAKAFGESWGGWGNNGPSDITTYQSEINAYQLNSYMYEASGTKSPGIPVWNNKWSKSTESQRELDRQASIDAHILANYKDSWGLPLSSSNQGGKMSNNIKVVNK
jgi:RHS repeat-associated protein